MIHFNPIQNIGLPSNMHFCKGGDIEDQQEFTIGLFRWCLFKSCGTWYCIKQENEDGIWYELWTKQLDSSLLEAKKYAVTDMKKEAYEVLRIIISNN